MTKKKKRRASAMFTAPASIKIPPRKKNDQVNAVLGILSDVRGVFVSMRISPDLMPDVARLTKKLLLAYDQKNADKVSVLLDRLSAMRE